MTPDSAKRQDDWADAMAKQVCDGIAYSIELADVKACPPPVVPIAAALRQARLSALEEAANRLQVEHAWQDERALLVAVVDAAWPVWHHPGIKNLAALGDALLSLREGTKEAGG